MIWITSMPETGTAAVNEITASDIGTEGFVYRPRGCGCHSETPTYLIAWRRGPFVFTVLASGSGASAKTAGALGRSLDRAVS